LKAKGYGLPRIKSMKNRNEKNAIMSKKKTMRIPSDSQHCKVL
jgi:hypothetical protein